MDSRSVTEAPPSDDLFETPLEELVRIKVNVSSSRTEQSVATSPSIVTVFTREDIKRIGARSVKDLIDRTVGVFSTATLAAPVVGIRGLVKESNTGWLMLIDGINVNSIVGAGMGSQFIYPILENAKRVEILRGPGSTLWGSAAAFGIIHIITSDGEGSNSREPAWKTTVDLDSNFEGQERGHHYNLRYEDKPLERFSYSFSFDFFNSGGYPTDKPNFSRVNYPEGALSLPPYYLIKDAWHFYGKAKVGKAQLLARMADLNTSILYSRVSSEPIIFGPRQTPVHRIKLAHIAFVYSASLHDRDHFEFRMFAGYQKQTFIDEQPYEFDSQNAKIPGHFQNSLGGEFTYFWQMTDSTEWKAGLEAVQTTIEPVLTVVDIVTREDGIFDEDNSRLFAFTPPNRDIASALVNEVTWRGNQWSLVAGARADHNNFRVPGWALIPRAAVIYQPSQEWTLKYLFNSGYVRPPGTVSNFGKNDSGN